MLILKNGGIFRRISRGMDANTLSRAIARDEPGVREHETEHEQQQEMSRECENKSNQPTPCHEPLQEMSRECENMRQNNEQ